jgi:hypothetical protein
MSPRRFIGFGRTVCGEVKQVGSVQPALHENQLKNFSTQTELQDKRWLKSYFFSTKCLKVVANIVATSSIDTVFRA